ncbi:MAG TPA: metallophosphoesterase [Gaiellaceae bacterium]|nr:metallophosphoesterase [Gaiellaceae bacterium]
MTRHIRIAAAGDVHASEAARERVEDAFGRLEDVDLVLLAGDLTTHGEPEQALVVADAARGVDAPVVAVLGNHDVHAGRQAEVARVLRDAGIVVLDRGAEVLELGELEVGVVGTKGFVGGFPGSSIPDFGERLLRDLYRETTEEMCAVERGLQQVAGADLRIVLLHYAPVVDTLAGEPAGIHAMLGSARLAIPIAEYQPDLVLHGHAHAGSFEGRIGETPVYNVAVHVTGRDFYVLDLNVRPRRHPEIEVESAP